MKLRINNTEGPSDQDKKPSGRKRGYPARPVVEFPEPSTEDWIDPPDFQDALILHMDRHGDTTWHLHRAVGRADETFDRTTIREWRAGRKAPRSAISIGILSRIERRYRLPDGYFRAKLPHPARAAIGFTTTVGIAPAERRRLAWHLPHDFDCRPVKERDEILEWVRKVIVSGATDYRRYQAGAVRQRFAVRFPKLTGVRSRATGLPALDQDEASKWDDDEVEVEVGTVDAPRPLADEVEGLVRFKTSTLTTIGLQRSGVWNEVTALQKVEHLGLLFGALTASPRSEVKGLGVPLDDLAIGLLVFPSVWDWYVQWREHRRGFYTAWEVDMLQLGLALTRRGSGWLRQHPSAADRLTPIAGVVSASDLAEARADWDAACDRFTAFAQARAHEIKRVARVHRDTFEPIMPVLEAASPVAEYRKITEEILRLAPDARRYPRAAAESARSFLMLRLGMHLGIRQKNLRQLLICRRDRLPTPERQLEARRVGEMRWSSKAGGWEVLIPSVAFKNGDSSFFGKRPFRLVLPDLGDLYRHIDEYVRQHRGALLAGATDPGTFFVKTVKATSQNAA